MMKFSNFLTSCLLAVLPQAIHAASYRLHAQAWTDFGRIMHSTDTLLLNYNGNWQQSMGMQLSSKVEISEHLQGGLGFGLNQIYHSPGSAENEKLTLTKFINYVSEARLTYTKGEGPNPFFSADVGDFSFNYAPYAKNLGLYLFRGPVYPGFLVSGFKDYHTDTTRASFLGFHLHNGLGDFQQDLIFSSERDLPPSFDWSLGYVARYSAFQSLQIGAGVNFYHILAENADITDPKRSSVASLYSHDDKLSSSGTPYHPYEMYYYEITAPGDTVFYTHRGTKVMGMFHFDPKAALGLSGPFGEQDLHLYGEMALVGVQNYGTIYSKRSERMPFMMGFNLPAFGFLDFLSIEVERYTAKYRVDYSKLGYDRSLYFKNINAPKLVAIRGPSAIPLSAKDFAGEHYEVLPDGNLYNSSTDDTLQIVGTGMDPTNLTADDWKWSVNAEKTVVGHVRFSGQVANDHFVPRPARTNIIFEDGGLTQAFSSMKDWYFMARIGYFF